MVKYKFKTFEFKNTISYSFEIGNGISYNELSAFVKFFNMYSTEIALQYFNVTTQPELIKYLNYMSITFNVNEDNLVEKDLSRKLFGTFSVNFIDSKNKKKDENAYKLLKKVLDFPTLDESFTDCMRNLDYALEFSNQKTNEQLLDEHILKNRYFKNLDNYFFNNQSFEFLKLLEDKANKEQVLTLFNNFISKIKKNVKNSYIYRNGRSDLLDKIEVLFLDVLSESNVIGVLKSHYDLETVEENYELSKTTAESLRFFHFDYCENYLTKRLTISYYSEMMRAFYLNEIRLKYNLIYSPSIWINGSLGQTKHEVKQENINFISELEDQFFEWINNQSEVRNEIFSTIINFWKSDALDFYEKQNWGALLSILEDCGITIESTDCEFLYSKYLDVINKLSPKDVNLEIFKYDGKTRIVGS